MKTRKITFDNLKKILKESIREGIGESWISNNLQAQNVLKKMRIIAREYSWGKIAEIFCDVVGVEKANRILDAEIQQINGELTEADNFQP